MPTGDSKYVSIDFPAGRAFSDVIDFVKTCIRLCAAVLNAFTMTNSRDADSFCNSMNE